MSNPIANADTEAILSSAGGLQEVYVGSGDNVSLGLPSDSAWSGSGDGTAIAILKAIYAQNSQVIDLLVQIESNTATT